MSRSRLTERRGLAATARPHAIQQVRYWLSDESYVLGLPSTSLQAQQSSWCLLRSHGCKTEVCFCGPRSDCVVHSTVYSILLSWFGVAYWWYTSRFLCRERVFWPDHSTAGCRPKQWTWLASSKRVLTRPCVYRKCIGKNGSQQWKVEKTGAVGVRFL